MSHEREHRREQSKREEEDRLRCILYHEIEKRLQGEARTVFEQMTNHTQVHLLPYLNIREDKSYGNIGLSLGLLERTSQEGNVLYALGWRELLLSDHAEVGRIIASLAQRERTVLRSMMMKEKPVMYLENSESNSVIVSSEVHLDHEYDDPKEKAKAAKQMETILNTFHLSIETGELENIAPTTYRQEPLAVNPTEHALVDAIVSIVKRAELVEEDYHILKLHSGARQCVKLTLEEDRQSIGLHFEKSATKSLESATYSQFLCARTYTAALHRTLNRLKRRDREKIAQAVEQRCELLEVARPRARQFADLLRRGNLPTDFEQEEGEEGVEDSDDAVQ